MSVCSRSRKYAHYREAQPIHRSLVLVMAVGKADLPSIGNELARKFGKEWLHSYFVTGLRSG